jgi:hypothetical protein
MYRTQCREAPARGGDKGVGQGPGPGPGMIRQISEEGDEDREENEDDVVADDNENDEEVGVDGNEDI